LGEYSLPKKKDPEKNLFTKTGKRHLLRKDEKTNMIGAKASEMALLYLFPRKMTGVGYRTEEKKIFKKIPILFR
jgi:hypothetical protein